MRSVEVVVAAGKRGRWRWRARRHGKTIALSSAAGWETEAEAKAAWRQLAGLIRRWPLALASAGAFGAGWLAGWLL